MTNRAFLLTLCTYFFIFPVLFADEDHDKAIQATASLLFHINQKISPNDQADQELSPLIFEKEDIEKLWSKALSLDSSLAFAQEDYWLGFNSESDDAKQILCHCAEHLRSVWLSANELPDTEQETTGCQLRTHQYGLNNLIENPLLNKKIKKEISPYLLPSNTSLAGTIDQIFYSSRPTFNSITLIQSGFNILHKQPRSHIIVASHPAVPGFLFKLYYDTELRLKNNVPGWKWFVRRCSGAELIKNVIAKKKIKHFAVPNKYIYVLPPATMPPKGPEVDPKLAVLIVQDMQLMNDDLNYAAWKMLVTPEILDELYIIISRANGSSYRPDNIPYTHAGVFAFIDTEYPHQDPDFFSIRTYLSSAMCNYWDELVKKGGP